MRALSRALLLLVAVLQPCEAIRLPLGAHRPGGQPWQAATRQINALLSTTTSSWRAAVAFTGCTLLIARGILARRRTLKLHRLAQASPVLEASQLSLPSHDDQGWDAWRAAGALLVARLRGSGGSSEDTLLLERVYQVYLPVYSWLKEMRRLTRERGQATLIGMQCLQVRLRGRASPSPGPGPGPSPNPNPNSEPGPNPNSNPLLTLQGGGKTTICDCLELLAHREVSLALALTLPLPLTPTVTLTLTLTLTVTLSLSLSLALALTLTLRGAQLRRSLDRRLLQDPRRAARPRTG